MSANFPGTTYLRRGDYSEPNFQGDLKVKSNKSGKYQKDISGACFLGATLL
jgi:hypothetical protein